MRSGCRSIRPCARSWGDGRGRRTPPPPARWEGCGASASVPDQTGSDTQAQTRRRGVGMKNVAPDLGPVAGTSGDGLRWASESAARTAKNTRAHPEHEPCSPSERQESSSSRGDQAVYSPPSAHGGRGRRIKRKIPACLHTLRSIPWHNRLHHPLDPDAARAITEPRPIQYLGP